MRPKNADSPPGSESSTSYVTYFAMVDGVPVFGRGDPDDGNSLASEAFASVPTGGALHEAIVARLEEAIGDEPILDRSRATWVLGRAAELAIQALSEQGGRDKSSS